MVIGKSVLEPFRPSAMRGLVLRPETRSRLLVKETQSKWLLRLFGKSKVPVPSGFPPSHSDMHFSVQSCLRTYSRYISYTSYIIYRKEKKKNNPITRASAADSTARICFKLYKKKAGLEQVWASLYTVQSLGKCKREYCHRLDPGCLSVLWLSGESRGHRFARVTKCHLSPLGGEGGSPGRAWLPCEL